MTTVDSSDFDDAKLWDLPSVDDTQVNDDTKTDAFNKPIGKWKFEAPEQEEEIAPLTAEDIEAIRSDAYQEGLALGKEEGFEAGQKEGLEKGHAEGFEAGKAQGVEQGEKEAKEASTAHVSGLAKILEQLNDPLAQVNEQVQQELVLLAVSLAKAVLKTEVSMSSESLKTAIREAIAVLPLCDTEYKIHLHPQDLETIQAEMDPSELSEKRWRLLSSTEQEQGGCKVVTESNAVDMSIARRCDQIFSALLLEQGMVDDPRAD